MSQDVPTARGALVAADRDSAAADERVSSPGAIARIHGGTVLSARRADELELDEIKEIGVDEEKAAIWNILGLGAGAATIAALVSSGLPAVAVVAGLGAGVGAALLVSVRLLLSRRRYVEHCMRFGLDAQEAAKVSRAQRRVSMRYLGIGAGNQRDLVAQAVQKELRKPR